MFSKPHVSRRRSLAAVVSALALLALSACVPGSPVPTPSGSPSPSVSSSSSPTPSESPTEEPEPEAQTVVISALTVRVIGDDGSTLVDVPYLTDATAAVAALTEVLGSPATSSIPGSDCVFPTTKYDWGGLIIVDPATVTAVPSTRFSALLTGAMTTGGVALQGPFAVTVGMTKAAVLAAAPGTTFNDLGSGFGTIALDAGDASPAENAWGTVAYLNSGVVSGIDSPVYHHGEC